MGKHGIDDLVYSKARELVYEQVKWTATESTFRSRILEKVDSKFSDCLADAIADSTIGSAIGIPVEDRDSILAIADGRNLFTDDENSLIERLANLPVILDRWTVGKLLTTLRLVDCGMIEIDKSLKQLKNLRLLNLSRNRIAELPGCFLPRRIRFLELYMNEVRDIRSLAASLPNGLVHLGIARNKLTDSSGLETLSNNRKAILRSLDIADNDIENLDDVITGLSPLSLTSLQMEGNPCSMNPLYASEISCRLPNLLYLDGMRLEGIQQCRDKVSDGGIIFRCFGLTGLSKEECDFHAELEIPLFDPARRLSIIQAILHEREGMEDVLRFSTERRSWSDVVDFPEVMVRVPYFAGLTELRDIFRSTVFFRIVKTTASQEIVAEFDVELESVPWWMTSLHYKWTNGTKTAVRVLESLAMLDTESVKQVALDVEFLPLTLVHKVHRNLQSSQVEIFQLPYYEREPTPEEEPEAPGELEIEPEPPNVTYAPPLQALKEKKNWWDFSKPVFAFNNPAIRSRLEMLMGSNVVRITDRKYMIKLQERIREDHIENLKKRIQEREADEVEREKKLILSGKISLDEAPKELKNHPICRINELAKKILEKRAKMKVVTKTDMYKTTMKRIREAERAEREMDLDMEEEVSGTDESNTMPCIPDAEVNEDICKGFMFTKEEYDRLRYEAPLVKILKEIDSVDEMYKLADQIVGPLKLTLK